MVKWEGDGRIDSKKEQIYSDGYSMYLVNVESVEALISKIITMRTIENRAFKRICRKELTISLESGTFLNGGKEFALSLSMSVMLLISSFEGSVAKFKIINITNF